jgi:hypothetical protein
MRWLAWAFADEKRFERAQRLARFSSGVFAKEGKIARLPFGLGSWTDARDAPALPEETFRQWWRRTRSTAESPGSPRDSTPEAPARRSERSERSERQQPQIENWMAELRDDPGAETVVDLFRPANPRPGEPPGPASGLPPGPTGPEPAP